MPSPGNWPITLEYSNVLKRCLWISIFSSLAACGGSFASSERQILPSFQPQELSQKRILLAPYSVSVIGKEQGIPLEIADIRQLGQKYPGPSDELIALEDFYDASQSSAQKAAQEIGRGASLVTLQAVRWPEYFADPERFMNVTVDGKVRYEVPQRELLQRLGLEADIAVVIGKLDYSSWIMTTETTDSNGGRTVNSSHNARCESRFLVWDYTQKRALAEGTVESGVSFGKKVEPTDFEEMGSLLAAEIMNKRPFR